jgi:alpha-beta hydrolase superfamily lysophospholipase
VVSTGTMSEERALAVMVDGNRLSGGVFVPAEPRGTVIALHGIPSVTPPDPDDDGYPGLARRLSARGWTAMWVDMRSVRGSGGHFSIEGWVRDLQAVVDEARDLDGATQRPLAIVASSAGGAVAVEAARRGAPVDALVLLGTPAAWLSFARDPADAVRRIVDEAGMTLAEDVLADPVTWADEFRTVVTERSVAHVTVPILVLHGTADDVVPADHGRRIAERAPNAELHLLDGAPHHLRRHPGVFELVAGWLERSLA